ncbi:MAG: heparinase II/III family protein [Clostridia bacterium]|nr:heparinase II/III family protein [Clostridia bacterium]
MLYKSYAALTLSDYTRFYETGDRATYDKKNFERREDMVTLGLALWLTEDDKYIKPLCDLIFHICNEFTWCGPAHVAMDTNPPLIQMIQRVDLFASETARNLTDVLVLVEHKLPYYVKERVAYEIRRRIIDAFYNTPEGFWWEAPYCNFNWAAVCSGGSAVATLHFGTEEDIRMLLPRVETCMEHFLSGFHDDGCCTEGYGYWEFGFGNFTFYADIIRNYTQGKTDYFAMEKVKNIALFAQKVRLGRDKAVCFSDSYPDFRFNPGLFSYYRKEYGKDFLLPELSLAGPMFRYMGTRDFIWLNPDYTADKLPEEETYFAEAQWYINRKKGFSFAAKAGHNDEHHNHNDVGSFMLVTEDEAPLDDFGRAIYINGTFAEETRYGMLVNASFGHSVPILGGKHQLAGREFAAKNVEQKENSFSFDMEGAYEKGLVEKLHRSFLLTESSITLTDTVTYGKESVTVIERMVSHKKPVISAGRVDLGRARILYDENRYQLSVSETYYRNNADTEDMPVYFMDFTPKNNEENEFIFKFDITNR